MRISDWSSDVCSSDLEKARRSLQDTPSSVAVTTARRIEEENLLSLQEVYARTANVTETFSAGGFTIRGRSEEHTSELQSLMRISYAVFCLKKKTEQYETVDHQQNHIVRDEI